MNRSINVYVLALASMLSASLTAQPLSVIGGNEKAQECFNNAEMAARNFTGISRSLLKPCDYALDYADLNLRDRAATFANRGIIYAGLGNYEAAMSDYDTAIALTPKSPESYVNRGNAFFMMRDFMMAMDDYEHSMDLGIRQLHLVHYNMGMAYEIQGNDETALRHYEKALELNPGWELPRNRMENVRQRMAAAQEKVRKAESVEN
jgi:tetratricopeptide (TPR) repeat protein